MIRDAKGAILAQKGPAIQDLPGALPAELEEREAVTTDGEPVHPLPRARDQLGRRPAMAAELGAAPAARTEAQKGGVEVAISKSALREQQRRRVLEALLLAGS